MPDDDRYLIEDCLARKPGAWEALLQAYGGVIAGSCRRALAHAGLPCGPEEIADAFSEVLGALLQDDGHLLRRHRPDTPLGAYLSVIATTHTRRAFRRAAAPPEPLAPSGDPVVEAAQAAEEAGRIRQALAALPSRDAEALRLFHLEGMRYAGIGRKLGIPEGQVGMVLARAREKLREALGKNFPDSG